MLVFTVIPIPKNKAFFSSVNYEVRDTYIVLPDNFVGPGVSMHLAHKIYVITFFNIVRVEIQTQLEFEHWNNCNNRIKYQSYCISHYDYILRYEKQQTPSQFCPTQLSIAEKDKSKYM
jgi:hypothetical protein